MDRRVLLAGLTGVLVIGLAVPAVAVDGNGHGEPILGDVTGMESPI